MMMYVSHLVSLQIQFMIFFDVAVVSRNEKHLFSVCHGQKKTNLMLKSCLLESLYPVFVLSGFCFIVITCKISEADCLRITVSMIMNLFVLLCAVHCSNYCIFNFYNSFIIIVAVFIVLSV